MSLNSNNQQLQTILDTVNALPDAGGSAAPETCTVTFETDSAYKVHALNVVMFSKFVNGERLDIFAPITSNSLDYYGISASYAGGQIMDKSESTPLTVQLTDIVAGSYMLIIVNVDIAYITTDSNCLASISEDGSPDWYGDKTESGYAYNRVSDVNQLRSSWVAMPSSPGKAGLHATSPLLFFKILGDTTIKIWDED